MQLAETKRLANQIRQLKHFYPFMTNKLNCFHIFLLTKSRNPLAHTALQVLDVSLNTPASDESSLLISHQLKAGVLKQETI